MLSKISWVDYFLVILLLLVVYYLFIGAKFYAEEISRFVQGRIKPSFRPASSSPEVHDDQNKNIAVEPAQPQLFVTPVMNNSEAADPNDVMEQVKELTRGIQQRIADAAEQNLVKGEFFLSLQVLLKKYAFLKGSPSMAAINNLIASECEKCGHLQLSAEERVMLWNE